MPEPLALPAPATTSLDRSDGKALDALFRAAIGPVHTDHYLAVFDRFEAAGRVGPGWNWAASLCTVNWMLFRQLWRAGVAYVASVAGLALLLFGGARLVFGLSETAQLCLLAGLVTLVFIAPGVWGNAILYLHTRKTMESALAQSATVTEACVRLNRNASSRQRTLWLALANTALAGIAIAAGMVWPGLPRPAPAAASAAKPSPSVSAAASPAKPISAATPRQPGGSAPAPSAPASAAPVQASMPSSSPAPGRAASESAAVHAAAAVVPAPTAFMAMHRPAPPPITAIPTSQPPGFSVNVGLFAQDTNAQKASARLHDAGLPVITQELETSKGKRTRVRVGPFDTRSEADAAAEKIHALGLDAVVFRQ